MSIIGYGPIARIDGPPPLPPVYGLVQAAEAPASGVRLVTDLDAEQVERWLAGVEVYPYPVDVGDTFNQCAPGSEAVPKGKGTRPPRPEFAPITVYLPETCTTRGVWDQAEFRARAMMALAAIEGAVVAHEFLTGERMKLQPFLSDGTGTFPNGDTPTSVANGIALLEAEIAKSRKQGLIHASPQVTTIARERFAVDDRGGVIRTINGVVVIPDFGYVNGASPPGHTAATGTQEWIYATGPIDLRRSQPFLVPDNAAQATDRTLNDTTYRAERYYLVDWDTVVHAAVLVDRCLTTCT